MRILTLDCGTSRIKAGVFHTPRELKGSGGLVAAVRAPIRLWINEADWPTTEETVAGRDRSRLDVDSYLDRVFALLKQVAGELNAEGITLDAICPAVSCPALVALDKHLRPLHPALTHLHRACFPQARELVELVGADRWLATAGNLPMPGSISLSSIRWLAAYHPHVAANTAHWAHLQSLLLYRLTSRLVIDPTQAAYSGLYDVRGNSGWLGEDWFELMGVRREQFPEVVPSASVAGKLTREAAAECGLPEGLPVIAGGADTAVGLLAAEELQPGCALNMSGNVEIMAASRDSCPTPSAHYLIRPHLVEGKWVAVKVSPVGGETLLWFQDRFCREMSPGRFWDWVQNLETGVEDAVEEIALEARRGDNPEFLPYLFGDRHSLDERKAGFIGLSGSSTRQDMLCAVLAAYRNSLNYCCQEMAAAAGRPLYSVVTSGGYDISALGVHRRAALGHSNLIPLEAAVVRGAAILAAMVLEKT